MSDIQKAYAFDGTEIKYINKVISTGSMKDVYITTDQKNVVTFFRDQLSEREIERLSMIVGCYRDNILNQEGGYYWEHLFCWPSKLVENSEKKIGILVPTFQDNFFFEYGSINNDFLKIKGKAKEAKWYLSPSNKNKYLDIREHGDWLSFLRVSILISRSVRRLHAAGLVHADLSSNNILVDPIDGKVCLIGLEDLVVPYKSFPDIVGTPDFIAPEIIKTSHLSENHPDRKLPSVKTNQHNLAVLIYMLLLLRHPLRGNKVHYVNDAYRDEYLTMGEKALFIEHPEDSSNKIDKNYIKNSELPWKDLDSLPYQITGPYLSNLFKKAFINGLHDPKQRPAVFEWEQALVKTVDLLQPCLNPQCEQKWYVLDYTKLPSCPFCGQPYQGKLPILNLYSCHHGKKYLTDNHRLLVHTGQPIYLWHINKKICPNERLNVEQQRRVGYFIFHNNDWLLVNERMPDLMHVQSKEKVPIGKTIKLEEGTQLLFSKDEGARLASVQLLEF